MIPLIRITVLIFASIGFASAQTEPREHTEVPPSIQAEIPSLKDSLASYFSIGAAIRPSDTTGAHSELLKKHFNSITAENAMKWASLEPSEGQIDFTTADTLVGFAKANNMRIRGHNLVWHKQIPNWVFKDDKGVDLVAGPQTRALVLSRLEKHIREVVSHFKDEVYAWDVVNEPIDPEQPDGFRRSLWFQFTGTDYIDTAFRVAHEAAPGAKLYLNDYDTTDPVKRKFLFNLVRDLKKRGIPIDGIGHQMHSNIVRPKPKEIVRTLKKFSELGLDNQITELDMSLYDNPDSRELENVRNLLVVQGYRYRDFFRAFRKMKGKVSSVTLWGIADDHTWLSNHPIPREDFPLLFDRELHAKYAYWGVVDSKRLPKLPSVP